MKLLPIFLKMHSQKNADSIKLNPVLVLLFILQLVACPLQGQVLQKKQLTEADYASFGELFMEKNSPDGNWSSFRMCYDNGNDTLFVKNMATLKTYTVPQGAFLSFAGNGFIIFKDPKQRFIQNLENGKCTAYPLKTKIEYAEGSNIIVALAKEKKSLELIDLKSNQKETIQDVADFSLSPSGRTLLLSYAGNEKYDLGYLALKADNPVSWIIRGSDKPFSGFKWDELGRSVSFCGISEREPKDASLYLYILKSSRLHVLESGSPAFPSGRIIDRNFTYPMEISNDQQRVFFSMMPEKTDDLKNKDSVEVWKTDDKWIFPLEQSAGRFAQKAMLAVWKPSEGSVIQISSSAFPKAMLNGDKSYAILSNPQQYEPQFEENEPRDFYLMDLKNGKTKIVAKNQSAYHADLLPSPSGRYIAFFKDKDWWIYDIQMRKYTNITQNAGGSFSMKSRNDNRDSAYGTACWTKGDKHLIVYSRYDVWLMAPNGSSCRKLTDGEKQQIRFRISSKGSYDLLTRSYDGYKSNAIDLNGGLILQAQGQDGKTGFYVWNRHSGAVPVLYGDEYIDKIDYIAEKKLYMFRHQRYDQPPSIMIKKTDAPRQVLFQSNPQLQQFCWGKSELVDFANSKGKDFKGILYYPADYKEGKKYPMVVHIYEKQSGTYNQFILPSLYMAGGYNPTVLSSKGYFVLCPDIEQEKGKVGEKAVDFTVSAVRQVIERGAVLPDKIGLIAHSFGSYEANYIITQTELFAAAVSGAGIADLASYYLNVGWDLNISDMTRFESGQWRMGKSLFEDPGLYAANSPITHAAKIKTPVLIWAGKADWHVNWNQSIEFYMALRRLGKTGTMLLYPKEKHAIIQRANQKDLSRHVHQWFGHYLKNEDAAPWMGS